MLHAVMMSVGAAAEANKNPTLRGLSSAEYGFIQAVGDDFDTNISFH